MRAPSSSRPPKRQRVGALHPRQAGGEKSSALLDLGQRRDDDRGVEDDHQVAWRGSRRGRRRVRRAGERGGQREGAGVTSVRGTETDPPLVGARSGAKLEDASTCFGGLLRFTIAEAPSALSSESRPTDRSDDHPDLLEAPQARRRAAQLREARGRRARGVHRGRPLSLARGHRPPRRRRHRDAVPALPDAPDLVEAVYVDEVEATARAPTSSRSSSRGRR